MLNTAARALIESGAMAHLVTINADGSPQVTVIWVGLDGDEVVSGHLDGGQQKLANIRRDPRVAISLEAEGSNGIGMRNYLVLHGRARITDGGGAELLSSLARTYLGPGVTFPPMPDPPPGLVTHVAVTRVGGMGPWSE